MPILIGRLSESEGIVFGLLMFKRYPMKMKMNFPYVMVILFVGNDVCAKTSGLRAASTIGTNE